MSGSANTHSKLSPSSASRWTNCTASVQYAEDNADMIVEESSSYADEGTQAHDYAEEILLGKTKIEDIPEDFRAPLQVYVDECHRVSDYMVDSSRSFVEVEVPLYYRKEDTGTCDFGYIGEDTIYIRDLKYGQGVLVSAIENKQLAIYAKSFIDEYDFVYDIKPETKVNIGIVQPRVAGQDPISTWEITVSELVLFCASEIDPAVQAIESGNTKFNCSEDTCKWCPAKGFCMARVDMMFSTLPENLEKQPAEYDEVKLYDIYKNSKQIGKFLKDVEEYLLSRALDGRAVEGTKVVQGRQGNTKWKNEEDALKFMARQGLKQDERMKMTAISPTQAKKLLSDKLTNTRTMNAFEDKTTRSEGKPTLADISDKRESLAVGVDKADEAFAELES